MSLQIKLVALVLYIMVNHDKHPEVQQMALERGGRADKAGNR